MYNILIAPFVRRMSPANASRLAMRYFKIVGLIPGGRFINRLIHGNRASGLQKEVFGLNFYNPVGLEAGLDRNADLYNDLNDLGFSFSEIGPLGLSGVRKAVRNIQDDPQNDILAACIDSDFLASFTLAYDFCDFFVIEIQPSLIEDTLSSILEARLTYEEYKPIVVKLQENAVRSEIAEVVRYCLMNGVDGIQARSREQIDVIVEHSLGRLPIIANCQVKSPEEAAELLDSGASLIEIGMDLVYQGPRIVRTILKYLENRARKDTQKQQ